MNKRKFHTIMWNGPESSLMLFLLHWILHDHAKMIVFVWNGRNSCKIMILMLNSIFVNLEGSERPMWGCQVSTWPCPINKNLNFSYKSFWDTFDCIIFYILYFNRIHYFLSFSLIFSLAKHALWDQFSKHEWINLIFLGKMRI